ncbi:MAG TPA: FdhF/YdeP family oxidoreductase [Actinomycetota bacterium]|nr:FdhF/YdeP family oxidoreductase [Actinomycetota bacterium]
MSRWDPSLWASKKPFGIGEQRPNNYAEIWNALKENRDELGFAWRILNQGVCDGCALGTTGMKDWTLDEIHLCNVRLRLLRLNTMPALDESVLGDVDSLRRLSSAELRKLGRLPYPMIRLRGDAGFRRIGWDEALDVIAEKIDATAPDRLAFYLTSRGMTNENYYVVQKCVRAMGTNSIDNAARVCHSPSTFGLKRSLGVPATTCSYSDWIGSDLVVFIGSNVANNQPVAMKYLYHAKKEGTKVAVVNNYREPGMDKYWVPSNVESAIFGTQIADRFFLVNVGGDIAFISGALKHMIENGWVDRGFIDNHSVGFDALEAELATMSWEDLEATSGASRDEMLAFARMVGEAKTAVIVWSMGVTQHEFGEDNVRAIINLGLSKGFVGRPKCGLMPIRGHSGVQGGAEMGAYTGVLPGAVILDDDSAAAFSERWGFPVAPEPGLTAPQMIDAAGRGELDVLFSVGGNFLEVMPDPDFVRDAMSRVRLRVHMDIVASSQMLIDSSDTVVLLPAATRYETFGGVTQTSTERRVIYNPEIRGRRIGEARPEWEVFSDLARRVAPETAGLSWADTEAIRREIADVVPLYKGIETLSKAGDSFQYGGPMLCEGWEFPTDDGRAHFFVVDVPQRAVPEGFYLLTTRRGKQFNSMIQRRKDPLTGHARDAILINALDARSEGLADGDEITLASEHGSLAGRVSIAAIAPGNLQAHWPEAQVLIDRERRSPEAGIPDYNAVVKIEALVRTAVFR